MLGLSKLFDSNDKQLSAIRPLVDKINALEKDFEQLSQEDILQKTSQWKEELGKMEDPKKVKYLDEILPEAYALVREAAKRVLKQRIFDTQILAGIALHQGKIAEQKTGEGKTLTATMPLYLNSLTGRGVHLITPNDYLARHGAGWMGPVYNYLGTSVGTIVEEKAFLYDSSFENVQFEDEYARHLREVTRQEVYKCDVTYGTNHEYGFDYLRDNMSYSLDQMVQTNPR
ncbi:MAG: preprotein translocase subunit SecA, partial [Patescibacteria group bacterium]